MHISSSARASALIEPNWTSLSSVSAVVLNLRMEIVIPLRAQGGSTTCTREPSDRRPSNRASFSSMRFPENCAMLRAQESSSCSLGNLFGVRTSFPPRST
jgi:hypothetical protein